MKQLKRYKGDQEYSAIGIRNGKYALIKQEFMQGCFKKEIYIYIFFKSMRIIHILCI